MTEHMTQQAGPEKRGVRGIASTVWVSIEYLSVHILEKLIDDLRVVRAEADLFLGAFFSIVGVFNWSVGKYCDGNSSDYLSCTRPTVYYYYGAFEIFLVLIGVSLILIWFVKRSHIKR